MTTARIKHHRMPIGGNDIDSPQHMTIIRPERIQSGSVWINDAHGINCQLPFGGYKQSGLGRELGPNALDAYTEVKTVALDLSGGRPAKPYALLLSHAEN